LGDHFVISTSFHPGIRQFATALSKRIGRATRSAVSAVLYLKSGRHFRERLLALSDREYLFTYAILDSPLPMIEYVSTVRLRPVTDIDQTYAQWTCEFNCAPDVESELIKTALSVYQSGFDSLARNLLVVSPSG
jgi:hypothetical protein